MTLVGRLAAEFRGPAVKSLRLLPGRRMSPASLRGLPGPDYPRDRFKLHLRTRPILFSTPRLGPVRQHLDPSHFVRTKAGESDY
jgi:hypothetical protein